MHVKCVCVLCWHGIVFSNLLLLSLPLPPPPTSLSLSQYRGMIQQLLHGKTEEDLLREAGVLNDNDEDDVDDDNDDDDADADDADDGNEEEQERGEKEKGEKDEDEEDEEHGGEDGQEHDNASDDDDADDDENEAENAQHGCGAKKKGGKDQAGGDDSHDTGAGGATADGEVEGDTGRNEDAPQHGLECNRCIGVRRSGAQFKVEGNGLDPRTVRGVRRKGKGKAWLQSAAWDRYWASRDRPNTNSLHRTFHLGVCVCVCARVCVWVAKGGGEERECVYMGV